MDIAERAIELRGDQGINQIEMMYRCIAQSSSIVFLSYINIILLSYYPTRLALFDLGVQSRI
jgi:hypothetical protein